MPFYVDHKNTNYGILFAHIKKKVVLHINDWTL